jgi:high-affinity nickel-transport protein
VLSLPILLAAGMSLLDTADGAFMSTAYDWAFASPVNRVYYNITVTGLSVAVALAIGTVELLQLVDARFALDSGFWGWLNALDFEKRGYAIAALFVLVWAASVAAWKSRRIEERWGVLADRG